jgi:uncharacterized protein YjbI with pentapeptide repeats
MADPQAESFINEITNNNDKVSRWNRYKAEKENIDLSKADLSNRDLKEFNFTDVSLAAADLFNVDLSGADLSRSNLSYAKMKRCNLANAFLTSANLKVTDLRGVNAVDTNFDFANLSFSKLNGAWLVGSSLAGANLEGADLRGANLKFANVMNANMKGANVDEADLTNVDLTKEQIKSLKNYGRAIIRGSQIGKTISKKKQMKAEDSHDDLFNEQDCYKILEVTKQSSLDDIAHAYKKKAKEYHPDRVNHLGEKLKIVAQREFERIQHAYKSLSQHKAKPAISVESISSPGVKMKKPSQMQADDYLKLIKENPYNDKLHYNLGLLYFQKGFVDLATQEYQKALKINPYNVYAEHNLRVAKLLKVLSGEE